MYAQKNKTEFLNFLHRDAFSPTYSSWKKAINNNFFATCIFLTADAAQKFLPNSINTANGHMKTAPKNMESIKPFLSIQHESTIMTTRTSLPVEAPVQSHIAYTRVVELTGKVFADQTGCFPVISNRGIKYICVLYDYDSSAILSEPIKLRSATYILSAYTKLHDILKSRGLKALLTRLEKNAQHH